MLGFWESDLNISVNQGAKDMTLENILVSLQNGNNTFTLNSNCPAIRYISEEEYKDSVNCYVEPNFTESKSNAFTNPKFIIFSAPGATGKTALAKHICYTKKGIYWDLPENRVADNSFQGSIAEAVGYDYLSDFVKSLGNGENFFVIDAFDEAEAGSGRHGIESFLRNMNSVTQNCKTTCAILMARTETALFIKNYCINNNIYFKHYEIGYFAEYNAINYVKNALSRYNIPITDIVNTCILEQFREIRRILPPSDIDSFLGYAPVLNALAASYDDEKNTLILLKRIGNSDNSFELMYEILNGLLIREKDKFIKALDIRIPDKINYSDSMFNSEEQLLRLFGMILFNDSTLFTKIDDCVPIDYHGEFLETLTSQLPQHPFVRLKEKNGEVSYEFTGTAFKDFVIAYNLSQEDTCDYVDEYLAYNTKYCPSQMLIHFFSFFSKKKISGKHIPLMYNSFKAHAIMGDKISVYINGNVEDCSVEFNLQRNNETILKLDFDIFGIDKGIYIDQLSNCYIDIDGDVYIGHPSNEARINNSTINCRGIVWCSDSITIEAYSPGECELIADRLSYTSKMPIFDIKTDNKKNFKVNIENLSGYFKLIPYKQDVSPELEVDNYDMFSYLVRRIFSCLRSHSKDTPARKSDFIDNRIINNNEIKRQILNFLLQKHILYTDEQSWLYKLDTNKLSEYAINWIEVKEGDYTSLTLIYDEYLAHLKKTP